jgi:hypothetical protein
MQPGYELFTDICEKYLSNPPLGPTFRPNHCQKFKIYSDRTRAWFFQPTQIIDGISELEEIFTSKKPPNTNRKRKSHTPGLSQDIILSQNAIESTTTQHTVSAVPLPLGGAYNEVIAPIFPSVTVPLPSAINTLEPVPLPLPLPPGGAYSVLAPIFHSLSSMAEVDAKALDIALEGLKKVHNTVSLYI